MSKINKVINNYNTLPLEIQYLIITYLNTNYTFDIDSIFFYFNPLIFIKHDNSLQVSLYSWYGTKTPDDFKQSRNILHTVFDRPYSIILERKFSIIAKKIYETIKKFNFKPDVINNEFNFIGTYGPLKNNILSEGNIYYNKLSNASWNFSTNNLLDYFKEINILDNNINYLSNKLIEECILKLENNIIDEIRKSMLLIKDSFKDIIKETDIIKKDNQNFLFYKICKKKSNEQVISEKIILRNIVSF